MPHVSYFGSRPPTTDDGELGDFFLDVSELESLRLILYGPKSSSGYGARQAAKLIVSGDAPLADGSVTVEVTSAAIEDSPVEVEVETTEGDSLEVFAANLRTALQNNATVGQHFNFSGERKEVIATAHLMAENDPTLLFSYEESGSLEAGASVITVEGEFAPSGWPAGQAQRERAIVAGTLTEDGTVLGTVEADGLVAPVVAEVDAAATATPQQLTVTVVGNIEAAGAGGVYIAVSDTPGEASYSHNVAVANNDTAAQVATKIRAALALDAVIAGGTGADIIVPWPARVDGQNAVAFIAPTASPWENFDTTAVGLTPSQSTVTSPGNVAGTPTNIATQLRVALAEVEEITDLFVISGAGAEVILTKLLAEPNDPTFNIAIANGTSEGITPAPTSTTLLEGHGIEPDPNPVAIESWPEIRRYCHSQILQSTAPVEEAIAEFGTRADSADYLLWVRGEDPEEPPAIYGPKGFFGWSGEPYVDIGS